MDRQYEEKPYMAQISASRISGGGFNLYGSPITNNCAVSITIKGSKSYYMFGKQRFAATQQKIEIWLSPTQWAELLTNMNHGDGVPCTVRWEPEIGYLSVNDIPAPDPISFHDNGGDTIKRARNSINQIVDKICELAANGKATKTELKTLYSEAKSISDNLIPNLEFASECLIERAETVKATVKQEIAAMIESAGIAHIAQVITESKSKQIDQGDK